MSAQSKNNIFSNHIIILLLLLSIPFLGLLGCGTKKVNTQTNIKSQKIVNSAYSQMGKKYRLGGSSPNKGFDCSGLVWWAYKTNGISVPRITIDQAKAGKKISKNNAMPGDIVVFKTSNSPRGLHTGIYAGNGSFIHSPKAGEKVRLESINIDYWKKKLVSFRRIIN